MPKYLSGASVVAIVLLILGVIATLVIGNEFYKRSTGQQTTEQTALGPQEMPTEEENYRPQQQETEMPVRRIDESTKQALVDKAILDIKSAFPDSDSAKFKIDSVRLDVRSGGATEDVVCGNVDAKNKPAGRVGVSRFVWHSSEEVEMEGEDNKALFQLAWSLFCRA
ncbi:MAG: hypothetical protein KKG92_14505 [Gammaproteobacteria bacterium]|nr:hypothetical protein [Gammaproteobacteria bacterium]